MWGSTRPHGDRRTGTLLGHYCAYYSSHAVAHIYFLFVSAPNPIRLYYYSCVHVSVSRHLLLLNCKKKNNKLLLILAEILFVLHNLSFIAPFMHLCANQPLLSTQLRGACSHQQHLHWLLLLLVLMVSVLHMTDWAKKQITAQKYDAGTVHAIGPSAFPHFSAL